MQGVCNGDLMQIHRLIYGKEMLCYSGEFVLQIKSSRTVLGSKHHKLIGPLTLDPTWGRGGEGVNVPQDASWLTYSAILNLHFTRIRFLKVDISAVTVQCQYQSYKINKAIVYHTYT